MAEEKLKPLFLLSTLPGKTIYIAGPMTGYKHYNAEAFAEAKEDWRCRGYCPITPMETNSIVWRQHYGRDFNPEVDKCDYGNPLMADMILEDINAIHQSVFIVVLDGWQQSKGTIAEIDVAQKMGKPVYDQSGRPLKVEISAKEL